MPPTERPSPNPHIARHAKAVKRYQEGQQRRYAARTARIVAAFDAHKPILTIACEERVSRQTVMNVLITQGRIRPQPKAQPMGAKEEAIIAKDTAAINIKWQTHEFARRLLAHQLRRDILPEGFTLSQFVDQCRAYDVTVPQRLTDAVAEAANL